MRLQFLRNNLTYIIWLCLYFVVNIILFAEAADRYKTRVSMNFSNACNSEAHLMSTQGPAVAIARGCGACLNFNPMFVLVLMFRHVLSWIRSTRFYFLFPLDNIIKLHKIVGWMIFFFACVHTFAHIANFSKCSFRCRMRSYRNSDAYFASPVSDCLHVSLLYIFSTGLVAMRPGSLPLWQYFFGVQTGVGWIYGTAGLTGVFLIIILTVMVFCALSCIRKKEFFEVPSSTKFKTHFNYLLYIT